MVEFAVGGAVEEGGELGIGEAEDGAVALVLGVSHLDAPIVTAQLDAGSAVAAAAAGFDPRRGVGGHRYSSIGTACRWIRSKIRRYSPTSLRLRGRRRGRRERRTCRAHLHVPATPHSWSRGWS